MIARALSVVSVLAFALPLVAAAAARAGAPKSKVAAANTLSPREKKAGWRLLFDGKTLAGWRGYKAPGAGAGWQVVDGAIVRADKAGDLVTVDEFADFELAIEWRVAPGGNSGIMFRVAETEDRAWRTGPEYQILDNKAHKDGARPETSTAACYALYPPSQDVSRPAGEWNRTRIVVRSNRAEHWLGGVKVVEYELGSDDWNKKVAASKFAAFAGFGKQARGHIVLQDHGDKVEFRNVKLRELAPLGATR